MNAYVLYCGCLAIIGVLLWAYTQALIVPMLDKLA